MSIQIWSSPEARFIYELKPTPLGDRIIPGYDSNHRIVVIARDSKVARKLAASVSGDENRIAECSGENRPFYMNTVYSTCQKIGLARRPNGQSPARERVVCAELHAG
jgi:hypothetical protein